MAQDYNINLYVRSGDESKDNPTQPTRTSKGFFGSNHFSVKDDKKSFDMSDDSGAMDKQQAWEAGGIVSAFVVATKIAWKVAKEVNAINELYSGNKGMSLVFDNIQGTINAVSNPFQATTDMITWQLEQRRYNLTAENNKVMLGQTTLDYNTRYI